MYVFVLVLTGAVRSLPVQGLFPQQQPFPLPERNKETHPYPAEVRGLGSEEGPTHSFFPLCNFYHTFYHTLVDNHKSDHLVKYSKRCVMSYMLKSNSVRVMSNSDAGLRNHL